MEAADASVPWWIQLLGYVGSFVIAVSLVPQLWKTFRTKSAEDISYLWNLTYITGLALSVVYLVIIGAIAAYVDNQTTKGLALEITLAVWLLCLKWLYDHKPLAARYYGLLVSLDYKAEGELLQPEQGWSTILSHIDSTLEQCGASVTLRHSEGSGQSFSLAVLFQLRGLRGHIIVHGCIDADSPFLEVDVSGPPDEAKVLASELDYRLRRYVLATAKTNRTELPRLRRASAKHRHIDNKHSVQSAANRLLALNEESAVCGPLGIAGRYGLHTSDTQHNRGGCRQTT